MIQQTSLLAYESIKDSLGAMQLEVLNIIRKGNKTNKEIAKILNKPINCITGRTRELVKGGYVKAEHKVTQGNGRKAIVWGGVKRTKTNLNRY